MRNKAKLIHCLFLILSLSILSACNQEDEFYDKPVLKDYYGTDRNEDNTKTNADDPTGADTTGGGTNLTLIEDNFTQNSAGQAPIDIVWVIDNSGSMQEEQENLAQNFSAFIDQFISLGLDFQMVVITTDPNSMGHVICDHTELNDEKAFLDTQAFKDKFTSCVKVGTNGSGDEQGFTTLIDFISFNANQFLRPQAYLSTIFLSDEEEHSSYTASDIKSLLGNYLNNTGYLKAYSIITETPINRWEQIGKKYMALSEITGGKWSSIHAPFYQTLSDMGGQISALTAKFPLSSSPVNQVIKVFVDGNEVTTGWNYLASENSIEFDQTSTPVVHSQITIKYYIQ